MPPILMGPVLSFRGLAGNGARLWRVTAMIAIASDSPAPTLDVEGKVCAAPVELMRRPSARILRYDLSVTLEQSERRIDYGFGPGMRWQFTVPAEDVAPRIAYVSCNGFSRPDAVVNLATPLHNVWSDLLCNHDRRMRPPGYSLDKEQRWHEERVHEGGHQRFHLLAMGGDQIYFDSIWHERAKLPELCAWTELPLKQQIAFQPSPALRRGIADYYFNLYLERWAARSGPAWGSTDSTDRGSAAAMASIPAVMMWDDHDIFDGWGSYPPDLQYSALFRHMFDEARRAFWVFQLQQREADLPQLTDRARIGLKAPDAPAFETVDWNAVRVADPLALPFLDRQPGFSHHFDIGAVSLLVLDLRTERSQTQILGEASWAASIRQLQTPSPAEHLLVMSSVPVAYPKLGLAELAVGIGGVTGGAPDVINGNADDLIDHWSHHLHEGERKRFIRAVMAAADARRVRITLLSGDVHVAAWGSILRKDVTPASNWMRINQLTSSSVVHPSPAGLMESLFLMYVNRAASVSQTIDTEHVVEMMRFPESDRYVQAARNWLALDLDREPFGKSGGRRLWASWRCERAGGFSNHLMAVHPVRQQQAEEAMAGAVEILV